MKNNPNRQGGSPQVGFFQSKKNLLVGCVTAITAVAFGCVSAFMITAAPESEPVPVQLAEADTPVKLVSPMTAVSKTSTPKSTEADAVTTEVTSEDITVEEDGLPYPESDDEEYEEEIIVVAPSFQATAPEIEQEPETKAVTEPETAPETEPLPQITENGTVAPDLPDGYLADALGVNYTIRTPKYTVTDEELIFVATIIQTEVMGSGSSLYYFDDIPEKYFEMLAVAQCIRNRMESSRFPNSASGVIFQSVTTPSGYTVYQFSPKEKLQQYEPTYEALVAASEVLREGVSPLPTDYYYFCATRICDYFESSNYSALGRNADGSFDKIEGHLTTFYSGN